ncbi:MAG: PorP/SprF family type IX secretion system membrane protein, partial [Bacteroidota bacterium]
MIRKSFILIVFGMLIIPVRVTGQDPQFSQFFSNPLYLAPSFAGLVEDTRVGMNYRKQWPEIPGAFDTYSFSFDHYFEAFNSGLGFFALKDEAGSGNLALTNLGLQYSFDFKISDYWHIR